MRLTRVHVEAPLAPELLLALPAGAARHLARVLRLTSGDALCLFNGRGGEYQARIESVHRDEVTVRIGEHLAVERESPLRIVLQQGIARGDKMDLILQKATELGASAFIPVSTARSTVRLDARTAASKQQHWQAVVISACEQSGRNVVPPVSAPQTLAQSVRSAEGLKLLLAPGDASPSLVELSMSAANDGNGLVHLLVGPEGGFDAAEITTAMAAGFLPCRLGPRVLRTETAGLAALAALQSLSGDLR